MSSPILSYELFLELKLLRELLPKEKMGPLAALNFLKVRGCFPNAVIAYRIPLSIHVTVASAECSFSKLKLLKSYLRSTMSQGKLIGLLLIAIENNVPKTIDYEGLVDDFASKNVRSATFK